MFQGKICFPSWLQEMNIQFTRADFVLCSLHVLLHTNVAPETGQQGQPEMALQTAFCSSAEVIYPTFFFKTKNLKKRE